MKTILVATDHSDAANNALHYAANLAGIVGADLTLFHVYHPSIHASNSLVSSSTLEHLKQNSQQQLEDLAGEIAQIYHLNVNGISSQDDTVKALSEYTAIHGVDLVVMGIDSNLMDYKLFGNTTTAVIGLQQFPVLVVPNDVPFTGIGKILYPCEFRYLAQDNNLHLLKEIAHKFEAKLEVFHVETTNGPAVLAKKELVSAMDGFLDEVEHTYHIMEYPRVSDGILREVESYQPDLLVMVPHKAGFFESLLKSSQTRGMTLKTRVPLLVLPNK